MNPSSRSTISWPASSGASSKRVRDDPKAPGLGLTSKITGLGQRSGMAPKGVGRARSQADRGRRVFHMASMMRQAPSGSSADLQEVALIRGGAGAPCGRSVMS